jgi:hypothetical protein
VAVVAGHYWVDAVVAVVGKMNFLHGCDRHYFAMTLMMMFHLLMMMSGCCCCFCHLHLLLLHDCFSALPPPPHHEIALDYPCWQWWPYGQSQRKKGYDDEPRSTKSLLSVSLLSLLSRWQCNGDGGTTWICNKAQRHYFQFQHLFSNRQPLAWDGHAASELICILSIR